MLAFADLLGGQGDVRFGPARGGFRGIGNEVGERLRQRDLVTQHLGEVVRQRCIDGYDAVFLHARAGQLDRFFDR